MKNDNFNNDELSELYNEIQLQLSNFWSHPRGNDELKKEFLTEILKISKRLNLL